MRLMLYILLACTLFLAGCGCVNPSACFRPVSAAWDATFNDPNDPAGNGGGQYVAPTRAPGYTCPPSYNCGGYGGGSGVGMPYQGYGYGGGYAPCTVCPQGNPNKVF